MLTCTASANPGEVTFGWSRNHSQVIIEDFTVDDGKLTSYLTLDASESNFGTYVCQANNSMGAGIPCEFDVQGFGLLKSMGGANIIIIVAVIAACIVALLIVIVVIILICRKHRKPTEKCKWNTTKILITRHEKKISKKHWCECCFLLFPLTDTNHQDIEDREK